MKTLKTIILILSLAVIAAGQNYQWNLIQNDAPFAPSDGAGGVIFNDKLVMIGGWNPLDPTFFPLITNNEVWSSPDGVTWSLTKPNTFDSTFTGESNDWEGRHTAGYVVHNERIFICLPEAALIQRFGN